MTHTLNANMIGRVATEIQERKKQNQKYNDQSGHRGGRGGYDNRGRGRGRGGHHTGFERVDNEQVQKLRKEA